MKQVLARTLSCKQEKLKSSQFQQTEYLLTPEMKAPGMELISGMTGYRDSISFCVSLCPFLSFEILGSFLLQMSFLHVVLWDTQGKVQIWSPAGSSLHHPISVRVSSSLPMPDPKSQKSLIDFSRVTFPHHEPIIIAQGTYPLARESGPVISSPKRTMWHGGESVDKGKKRTIMRINR